MKKNPVEKNVMALHNLFISHSWGYSDAYEKVISLLNSQTSPSGFNYKNYSVPKDDPIHNAPSDTALRAAIEAQMRSCSCVVILAGVYATHSKWINIEIEMAKKLGKRIIAIEPWASERTSAVVKDAAHKVVKWNGSSIVGAITA
ncbi:TIR domain-containing protein [Duganella sp. BJB1802]|uniref:TIR domain-containing protein n=1 Tax=Duganella sp. BJB1802 TaxID=2744575 RepID=UPI001E342B35|nr:TIR domain-containing protein [Duganella sp. BJB1802]